MPTAQMIFDILGRDGASGPFRKVAASADGTAASIDRMDASTRRVNDTFNRLGKVAFGLSAAFVGFAVKDAVQFQQAMTKISTQAGVSQDQLGKLSSAILNLAPKVGEGPEALATSLYHVESAFRTTGISAQQAMDIVSNATKLAKIGGADLETTTQAIVGVLASRIKGVKDATDAAAQLNQVVGAGDTTLSAVTKSIATGILPTAQSLGLSFKDVGAALATLTDNATPADAAATRLRTSLSLVEKPTTAAVGALQAIGLKSTSLAEDMRKPDGLLVAMEDLKAHLEATYPSSQKAALSIQQIKDAGEAYRAQQLQNGASVADAAKAVDAYEQKIKGASTATLQAQTILQAFGGAKSGATILTLYDEIDRLSSKYKDFGSAVQAAAKYQQAWAQQQQTAKQKLDELKASWDVFLVKVGNAILPALKDIVDVLGKHPGIIQAVAVGVGVMATAWAGFKVVTLTKNLAALATRILAIGSATTVAATEVRAASLPLSSGLTSVAALPAAKGADAAAASAYYSRTIGKDITASSAEAAATASLGARAGAAALRVVVPVAITYAAVQATGNGDSLSDLIHGQFVKAASDAPAWERDLGVSIRTAITGSISGTAQNLSADPFLQGAIQQVMNKYGKDAAQSFTDALKQEKGNVVAAWQDVSSGIAGADPLFFSKEGQKAGATFWQNVADAAKKIDLSKAWSAQIPANGIFGKLLSAGANQSAAQQQAADVQAKAVHDLSVEQLKSVPLTTAAKNAIVDQGQASQQSAQQVDDLVKAVRGLVDTNLSAAQTHDKFVQGINDLGQSLDASTRDITGNSDAAIGNKEALLGLISTAEDAAAAYAKQTGKSGDYGKALALLLPQIENTAVANGINKQSVDDLFHSLGLLPPDKKVPVTTPGSDTAIQNVNGLQTALNNLPRSIPIDIGATINGSFVPGLAAAWSAGSALPPGASVITKAFGGFISGPGGPKDDMIPALLSNGEYVVRASSVAKYGKSLLDAINVGHFADGGIVVNERVSNPDPFITRLNEGLQNLVGQVSTLAREISTTLADPSQAGPGQSYPLIIDFMRRSGISFTQADSGLNRGGHSWHEAGDAVDFSGGNLDAMAQYWYPYAAFLLEEIHSPSWFVKNGKVVGPGFYGADIVAQHYNHVHIAATVAAMQQLLGAGAGMAGAGLSNPFGGAVGNLAAGQLSSAQVTALAQAVGLPVPEFTNIAYRESGFNSNAYNPTSVSGSHAYGLWQILWPANAQYWQAGGWKSPADFGNPMVDARAAAALYRAAGGDSPWALTRDQGGILPNNMAAINTSGHSELVLTNAQWGTLAKLAASLQKSGVASTESTVATQIANANKAIAAAVKDGNTPLERYITGYLKNAENATYATALGALKDKAISGAEFTAITKSVGELSKLTAALNKASTVNQNLITSLGSFVDSQQQYRDSLLQTIQSGSGFSDIISHSGTAGDVQTLLSGKLSDLRTFAAKIGQLKKAGWSDAIIRSVSDAGPGIGSQYADVLLGASSGQRSSIGGLFSGLTSAQSSVANAITKATGGTAGLTSLSALNAVNSAIFKGAGKDTSIAAAEKAQRQGVALMNVQQQNIYNETDLTHVLNQAAFLQSSGHFG